MEIKHEGVARLLVLSVTISIEIFLSSMCTSHFHFHPPIRTPVPHHNTEEFQKYKEKAALMAKEIEASPETLQRAELENTKDEETLHSAVIRDKPSHTPTATTTITATAASAAAVSSAGHSNTMSSSHSYKLSLSNNKSLKNDSHPSVNNSLLNRNLRQPNNNNLSGTPSTTPNSPNTGSSSSHNNANNQDVGKFNSQKLPLQQQPQQNNNNRPIVNISSPLTTTPNTTPQSNNLQGSYMRF